MLKELAYRAACTGVGVAAMRQLGRLIDVPELPLRAPAPRHPVHLVLTIDTEGGYVAPDEGRVWQGRDPFAFQGYVDGVRNLLAVLTEVDIKATFLVSPHGLSATGAARLGVERALAQIIADGHEIGLHLHPMSDRAIATELGRSFTTPSARGLTPADRLALLTTGKRMLEDQTGAAITSFRWGNWALDPSSAHSVVEAGLRVDSSAVPRIRDRRARFDWSASGERTPWRIAPGLLEVPIATYRLGRTWLRADPLYGPLLDRAFDLHRARAPRVVAPFPFVVMTHSTEAAYRDGAPTRTLADLARFLKHALGHHDVRAVRLGDVSWPG